jgi:septum formation protein
MADLYLASRSPRRRDLLQQIGVRFEPLLLRLVKPRGPDIDEARSADETPATYVERVAREKVDFGVRALTMRSLRAKPVLAADTIVVVDGDVLEKPIDAAQAAAFLRRLSGRAHEVRTAVAIGVAAGVNSSVLCTTSVSTVTLRTLTTDEIARYVATSEPYDKAGGYAIQGRAAIFIEHIEGSYSGVMGLPLFETAALLKQVGIGVL